MSEYVILTDSSCDLPAELADELEISVLPLSVLLAGKTYFNYLDGREIALDYYYAQLRAGAAASTSAVNVAAFTEEMEKILRTGRDVLYLGFSSGLSATYSAGAVAAEALAAEYPDRKIYTVDTLCASLGEGMMVYLAAQQKRAGKTIEEVRDYVEQNKLRLCHWFTVDDLNHLKRGGRISSTTALLGTALHIKPVLHVDNEGRLVNMEKARGRKAAIRRLAEVFSERAVDPQEQTIFISHGDCEEEARELGNMIREQAGVRDVVIHYIGPVIGAHAGPGTIALFFLGTER